MTTLAVSDSSVNGDRPKTFSLQNFKIFVLWTRWKVQSSLTNQKKIEKWKEVLQTLKYISGRSFSIKLPIKFFPTNILICFIQIINTVFDCTIIIRSRLAEEINKIAQCHFIMEKLINLIMYFSKANLIKITRFSYNKRHMIVL